jgi:hypothetical protein
MMGAAIAVQGPQLPISRHSGEETQMSEGLFVGIGHAPS